MRISGTEPSSVILSQTKHMKFKKLKGDAPPPPKKKSRNKIKPKGMVQ